METPHTGVAEMRFADGASAVGHLVRMDRERLVLQVEERRHTPSMCRPDEHADVALVVGTAIYLAEAYIEQVDQDLVAMRVGTIRRTDRRTSLRVPCALPVRYRDITGTAQEPAWRTATAENIGHGGMCLRSAHRLPTTVDLCFQIEAVHRRVSMRGRSIYRRVGPEGLVTTGMAFVGVAPLDQVALARFVEDERVRLAWLGAVRSQRGGGPEGGQLRAA